MQRVRGRQRPSKRPLTNTIMIASKAVTSPLSCIKSAKKRMELMAGSYPVDVIWLFSAEYVGLFLRCVRNYIPARLSLVNLVQAVDHSTPSTLSLASAVSHACTYLKMAGKTGFQLVCQYVVAARAPIPSVSAYRVQVPTFVSPIEIYK